MSSVNNIILILYIAIFAFKKLLQFSWKYGNYEYEIKAYDHLWMQYFFKSDHERCKFYHKRAEEGKCEKKDSYIRYLNEANLHKKEREQIFNYGKLKMHDYDEGIQRLATDVKFCDAILQHSQNLEWKKNMIFNHKTSEYLMTPKQSNDIFPGLSLFDFSQQAGIQVLIRLDTPINKIRKIEAPSPTLATKLRNRKAKLDHIPEAKFQMMDSGSTSNELGQNGGNSRYFKDL